MKNNIEVNGKENWVKIKIDSTIFSPQNVVFTANEYKGDEWVVMDSNSDGDLIVKILPKNDKKKKELREMGLDFQTKLVTTSVESEDQRVR